MLTNFATLAPLVKAILLAIIVINGIFLVMFLRDYVRHRAEAAQEPGHMGIFAPWSYVVFLLSTFGISDFALSTIFYRQLRLIDDKRLPGTLNTQCVVPVAVMALAYITAIKVDTLTLISCIVAQVLGAFIGPRFVVQFKPNTIRWFMGAGLLVAAFFILGGKLGWIPGGGELTGLGGARLIVALIALFIFGALNAVGIGSYAPTMATIYALGLSPAVAFPIMMGACTFSVPVGSMQFVRFGQYGRKITLASVIFGVLGVLTAVFIVKSMNTNLLAWVVFAVILIAAIQLLYGQFKAMSAPEQVA